MNWRPYRTIKELRRERNDLLQRKHDLIKTVLGKTAQIREMHAASVTAKTQLSALSQMAYRLEHLGGVSERGISAAMFDILDNPQRYTNTRQITMSSTAKGIVTHDGEKDTLTTSRDEVRKDSPES